MTIKKTTALVYEDEKRTVAVPVVSFELSGIPLPRYKSIPVKIKVTGSPLVRLSCSHLGADLYVGTPISVWSYWRLWWHNVWRSS